MRRPRDRVPRALLLLVVIVGLTTTTSSAAPAVKQRLKLLILRFLPGRPSMKNLDDTPDKWSTAEDGRYQVPQIVIHLLKDRFSPNERYYTDEHKQPGSNYEYVRMTSTRFAKRPRRNTVSRLFSHALISAKTTLANDEKKLSIRFGKDGTVMRERAREDEDWIVMPDRIPQVGSRNIIHEPTFCPKGHRLDSNNVCRPEM